MDYRRGEDPQLTLVGGWRSKASRRSNDKYEVELSGYEFFARRDPLNQTALDRTFHGPSSRPYRFGLEPVGVPLASGKAAISRLFVAVTARKLKEFLERDLSHLDVMMLSLDGIETELWASTPIATIIRWSGRGQHGEPQGLSAAAQRPDQAWPRSRTGGANSHFEP